MKKLFVLFFIILTSCNDSTNKDEFSLQFLHFNDIHTSESLEYNVKVNNTDYTANVGGYARLIQALNNTYKIPAHEIIFAGDIFQQGYPLFTYTKGKYDYEMMCMTSSDIITFGNHELYETDTGILSTFMDYFDTGKNQCDFQIVLANVTFSDEKIQKHIKPYIIKTYGNQKVAYFGVTTNESGMAGTKGMVIKDPFETAKKVVEDIKKENINKIIAVSHLGFEDDKILASKVPDIDVIIGGHTHTIQGDFSSLNIESYEKSYPLKIGNTYIVTAGSKGMILGNVTFKFNKDGIIISDKTEPKFLINPFDNSSINDYAASLKGVMLVEENSQAAERAKVFYSQISQDMNEIIGQTLDDLYTVKENYASFDINNKYNSSLGTLLAKSLYDYSITRNIRADFSLINSGAIRTNIYKGDITAGDINKSAPFENQLYVVELKGSVILNYVTSSIANFFPPTLDVNSFPYIYNAEFTFDNNTKTLSSAKYKDENGLLQDITADKTYKVILSSYLADNKEEFINNILSKTELHMTDKRVYSDYIINNSPVSKIEDTITITE